MKPNKTAANPNHDRANSGICRGAQHAFCAVLPLWQILDGRTVLIIPTLATALVIDGALLIAFLLILRPRRAVGRTPDMGNIWRRTVLPVFSADILSTLVSSGFYLLCLRVISAVFRTDFEYLRATAQNSPFNDLFTLVPAVLAVALGGGVTYLICRKLIFGDGYRYQNAAALSFLLALGTAPYSLLFSQILARLA